MKRTFLFFIFQFALLFCAYGFPLQPRIINYSVHDYKAGNQNWSITQDKEGRIYVANNKGVLEFDGINWTLYPLPHQDVVRCVYYASDGRLYVGSYEEFGYFERNSRNHLEYTSFRPLLQDYTFNNDEIWNIVEYQGKIYFQYFSSYFCYDGSSLKAFIGFAPLNMFLYDGQLFSQQIGKSLSIYEQGAFREFVSRDQYENDDVIMVLPGGGGKSLLFTRNQGLFQFNCLDSMMTPWKNEVEKELKSSSINKAILTKDSCYIIGTLSGGVYALDSEGKLRWKVNTGNGLINNTVLNLFCDKENNIWVALDNGVACVCHDLNLYMFVPTSYHIGMIYDLLVKNDICYIASNQGLYVYYPDSDKLKMIPGIGGQTWSISEIDEQIICGHNTGSFRIEGEKAIPISSIRGARSITKCTIHNQDILLQNTYTFLNVYRKDKKGEWHYSNRVEKFMNLIEHIEVDHIGNVWAQHMHRGIYQIRLSESLTNVEDVKYYNTISTNSNQKINLFKIKGRIVFTGEDGFYTYDDINKEIIPYEKLNKELPTLVNTYKVVQKNNSEYWFIDNNNYSLVEFSEDAYTIRHRIPLSLFEDPPINNKGNVFITSDGETYFALNGGLAKFVLQPSGSYSLYPELKISEVAVYNNQATEKFYQSIEDKVKIDYRYNNVYIALFAPVFQNYSLSVRYRLDGLDEKNIWHESMEGLKKEYSRLSYGEYTFRAELYDDQSVQSVVSYSFTINRPFYLSYIAITLYFIVGLLLFSFVAFLMYRYINKKKNKQLLQQKREHEAHLAEQQKQITELEKQQMVSELRHKSKELANFTMMSIRNKEFLIRIKEELENQLKKGQTPKLFLTGMIRIIDDNITSNDDWALFQSNFDRIHENFFRNLKERYPELTSNDLRLCALLRLNLTTKDISNMMNISVRGVEAARYRLRKRLNIPSDQDIVDFMVTFK